MAVLVLPDHLTTLIVFSQREYFKKSDPIKSICVRGPLGLAPQFCGPPVHIDRYTLYLIIAS
jgi:hypothetical protein